MFFTNSYDQLIDLSCLLFKDKSLTSQSGLSYPSQMNNQKQVLKTSLPRRSITHMQFDQKKPSWGTANLPISIEKMLTHDNMPFSQCYRITTLQKNSSNSNFEF